MAIICPDCGAEEGVSVGVGTDDLGSVVSRYLCRNCDNRWLVPF